MGKKKTDLVPVEQDQALAIAEEMGLGEGAGQEEFDSGDFIVPRLALAQAMSPQMKKSNPNYNPDLEEGDFFNTVTGDIFGKKVHIQCIDFKKPRRRYSDNVMTCKSVDGRNGSPGGIDKNGRATDECAACLDSTWANNEPPKCTEFKNYIVLLPENPEAGPMMLEFKNTSIKAAKQLATLIQTRGGKFMQQYQFELGSTDESSKKGEYKAFTVNNAGDVSQEQFALGAKTYKEFKTLDYKVEGTDTQA